MFFILLCWKTFLFYLKKYIKYKKTIYFNFLFLKLTIINGNFKDEKPEWEKIIYRKREREREKKNIYFLNELFLTPHTHTHTLKLNIIVK